MCVFARIRLVPAYCNSQYVLSGSEIAINNGSGVTHESNPFHGLISYIRNYMRGLEEETFSCTLFEAIKCVLCILLCTYLCK